MQKQIIIMCGMATSGKGEVTRILEAENYSIVDPVRKFLNEVGATSQGKSEKWRKLMSDIKLLLEDYDDIPYQCVKEEISKFNAYYPNDILCVDMREQHDIERLKKEYKGNLTVLFVERVGINDITSNPADANVYNIPYDYKISNNGDLEDLKKECDDFIKWLIKHKCNGIPTSKCLKYHCTYLYDDDGGLYCGKN